MFQIDIKQLVPKFLLADKDGYAVAKAIETALNQANAILQQGVECLISTDAMPEWRLDELAREYGCPYDYSASVDAKRRWIADALVFSGMYGTEEIICRYLEGYFDSARVAEAWEYGGEPYHFRMHLTGEWTAENILWSIQAIQAVKNVRSVLDGFRFLCEPRRDIFVGCASFSLEKGRFIVSDQNWYVDERAEMLMDETDTQLIVEE